MKRILPIIISFLIAASVSPLASATDTTDARLPAAGSLSLLSAYVGGCRDAEELSSMLAVAAVILNRCADDRFPDSISANGASLGIFPTAAPSDMAVCAARLALSGVDPTSGAVYMFRSDEADAHAELYVTFSVSGLCFAE